MTLSKFLAATALTALATLANAETFNFSYTINGYRSTNFEDRMVTGTFDGVRTGDVTENYSVTHLSNVSVFVDGVAFVGNGNLRVGHVSNSGSFVADNPVFAVAFRDGDANDLMFIGDNQSGWANIFYSKSINGNTGYKIRHPDTSVGEQTVATHWHLNPVPEPETYAMLLAGLGLVGVFARRHKANLTA